MTEKIKHTVYLAGYIEAATSSCAHWRNEVKEKLKDTGIVFYDPVEREAQKTGKASGEHVKYVVGLKQSGNWKRFSEEMDKIWFGSIKPEGHIPDIFTFLRTRKLVDGNESRDLCVDIDTQAMTLDGIKSVTELHIGDKIATYNKKTKQIEYQPILKIHKYNKPIDLITLHRKKKQFYVSPNHKILYQWHLNCLRESKAKNLYKRGRKINIPMWQGIDGKEIYTDDEVKLIAWILSEGSIHFSNFKTEYVKFGSCKIVIYQNKNSKSYNRIKQLLNKLGLSFGIIENRCNSFIISSKHREYIFNLLEIRNKQYKKQLPSWLYNTSLRQKEIFLAEYLLGDGSERKNEKVLYFSNNSLLKNNMIRLLLSTSIAFNITEHKSGFSNIPVSRIHLLKSKQLSMTFGEKIQNYNIGVWCPQTKNGTWIAVRNGVFFITGNSFWADFEATIRSDFIIANVPNDIKTIGTIGEIFVAYMFRIPIYLVIDIPKKDCNSTLLYWVLESGGDIFYSVKDMCEFIRDKYKKDKT